MLAATEGRVISREEIYERVWGYAMVRGDRSVDVLCASFDCLSVPHRTVATSRGTSASAAGSLPSWWTRRLLVTLT